MAGRRNWSTSHPQHMAGRNAHHTRASIYALVAATHITELVVAIDCTHPAAAAATATVLSPLQCHNQRPEPLVRQNVLYLHSTRRILVQQATDEGNETGDKRDTDSDRRSVGRWVGSVGLRHEVSGFVCDWRLGRDHQGILQEGKLGCKRGLVPEEKTNPPSLMRPPGCACVCVCVQVANIAYQKGGLAKSMQKSVHPRAHTSRGGPSTPH